MRYATKGSKGSKTYSSTEEDTTFLGSLSRRLQKNPNGRSICVLSPHAFTMTLQGLLETSQASKSTTLVSTARRSGSVKSALRDMLCNLIGKPIPRPVVLENTDVTVALSSLGNFIIFLFYNIHSYILI